MLLKAQEVWEGFLEGMIPEWDVEEEFCHLDKLGKAFQAEDKT